MSIGLTTWNIIDILKISFIEQSAIKYNTWSTPFFNPIEASLINYLISSFLIFLCFVYFYSRLKLNKYSTISFICRRASFRNKYLMFLVVLLFIPFAHCPLYLRTAESVCMLVLAFLPATIRNKPEYRSKILRSIAVSVIILLLGAMVWETLFLIKGPVYALNEFLPLSSTPQIDGKYINIGELPARIDSPIHKKLASENISEYFYMLSNRGIFNHTGHILNPINEYLGGKNTSKIYFQYSLGFSFIYKWTMELFGGLALQNYYKCHLFYILYWALYLFVSIYLFRSVFYVLFSVVALASGFFMLGYDSFVIAPGINPLIHFFDIPLLFFLFRYFKNRKIYDLTLVVSFGVFGLFINQQFGLLGMFAALLTLAMFYLENEVGVKRLLKIALLPFAIIAPLVIYRTFQPVATDAVYGYFLKGYFSFRPSNGIVAIVIANAALSYAFLLWKKNDTNPFKYVFVFLFLYFQALLVYFYWSGLINHFWPIFPIMGLQILTMARMLEQSPFLNYKWVTVVYSIAILAISIPLTVNSLKTFYRQKKSYTNIFATHKVYSWDFDRAKILSTINPAPISDSVALLHQYSGSGTKDKGVIIISVFDNIVPLLADRYSLMPFFEMQWFLISKKDVETAVQRIKQLKPEYIFVGHEVESEQFYDPWHVIFEESTLETERTSARGRLAELRNIFKAVSLDYIPIKTGQLLTVYKRTNWSHACITRSELK